MPSVFMSTVLILVLKLSVMEVTGGSDGALAAGIAVAATMQLFVCTPETSHVGINRVHIVLNMQLFSRKCTLNEIPGTKARRAARRDPMSRLDVGVPPTKLLLRLTE